MPGAHTEQKLVGCWCNPVLLREIDTTRGRLSRSQFLRDALVEKARRMGVELHEGLASAPDRVGKGGPRPVKYRIRRKT